jgi:arylsulfatase A-like enzyme
MPVLKAGEKIPARELHWQFGAAWAVRQGPWKLIGNGDKATTLVNLESDLGEQDNRIKDQPELAGALMKRHRQWVAEVGDK